MQSSIRFLACAFGAIVFAGSAFAQGTPSPAVAHEASVVATACINNWQAPSCIKGVSAAAMVLTQNYSGALKQAGHTAEANDVVQHCAASTAGMQQAVPVAAMRSALTECANDISDVSQKTGVMPDASQYQLLVGPALCLANDPQCASVNAGLKGFVGR